MMIDWAVILRPVLVTSAHLQFWYIDCLEESGDFMFKPPSGTFSTGILLKSVTLWGHAAGTESTHSTFPIPPTRFYRFYKIGPWYF